MRARVPCCRNFPATIFQAWTQSTDLLELGLDSLLLTQAATLFQRKFGVRITFRQLMEELSSLDAIASHLDAQLPPEAFAPAAAATPQAVSTMAPAAGGQPNAVFEQLLQQQQQLTNQLLELMGRQPVAAPVVVAAPAAPSAARGAGSLDGTEAGGQVSRSVQADGPKRRECALSGAEPRSGQR